VKILAIERDVPHVAAESFGPYLQAEAARAWELYQTGVIRELFFRADCHNAVLVLECADVSEAHAALNTLPLVREGLIAFEVIPLTAYPGFGRLFAAEQDGD
jgi:muconolactone delta-isomerase